MKYIVFWEFDTDNMEKIIETNVAYLKEHEKNPGKYQKYIFPAHYMGNGKGFSVVEIEKQEQLVNTQIFFNNVMTLEHHPITDAGAWIEAYMKSKA